MKRKVKKEPNFTPMRVTEAYKISGEVEFYDVDLNNDNFMFMCPYKIENLVQTNKWAKIFTNSAIEYFNYVLSLLHDGNIDNANKVFTNLNECNLTRLGMSEKGCRGKGIDMKASYLLENMNSFGFKMLDFVERIQDIKLFAFGIKDDKISDAFTNIIKKQLIEFTQEMCVKYSIPMEVSKILNVWNNQTKAWETVETLLPVYEDKPLLLIPKCCVTEKSWFNAYNFANKMILEDMQSLYVNDKDKPTKKSFKDNLKNKKKLLNKDFVTEYLAINQKQNLVAEFRKIVK